MNALKFLPLVMALALTACGDKNDTAATTDDTAVPMSEPEVMPASEADVMPEPAPVDTMPPAAEPAPAEMPASETTPAATLPTDGADAAPAAGGKGDLAMGEKIYSANCVACHATGVAGAPKIGDKAAWEPHLAKGIETLHTNSIKGINAMPPKGGNLSLTDEETKAAVDYMVSKVS